MRWTNLLFGCYLGCSKKVKFICWVKSLTNRTSSTEWMDRMCWLIRPHRDKLNWDKLGTFHELNPSSLVEVSRKVNVLPWPNWSNRLYFCLFTSGTYFYSNSFFKLLPLTQSWELAEFLRELAPNPEMVLFLVERVSREKIVNYTWRETLRFKVWEFLGHLWVK